VLFRITSLEMRYAIGESVYDILSALLATFVTEAFNTEVYKCMAYLQLHILYITYFIADIIVVDGSDLFYRSLIIYTESKITNF